ncbi:hypothetical protein PybrP1_012743 [[Pythium] brassicae (nom. inval.)]|nr:hypothetical protein PybrP1_012743 [[Pythium] brassicae (nom. inval.)]
MSSHDELVEILAQLRAAVRELRLRGLKQAAKFASELVLGVPDELRAQLRGGGGAFGRFDGADEDDDSDRYDAASASFDAGEFLRAHQLLASARCAPGSRAHFLRHYALFMAGEKAKEEMDLEIGVTGAKSERSPQRNGSNPHLKALYLSLSGAYQQSELDAFGLYLYAVVLKRLGYRTSAGRADVPLSAASTPTHHPPDAEEEAVLSESCPWMFHLFQAHALLDQQQNDAARQLLDHLTGLFPRSTYLVAQQALTSYHMRDFDEAQEQFERLALADPHRVETMDVYSNVLYVKEDKTELSRLAHRALKVEKYRPETCCIIGNYYSLQNKHDRAIVYFHRALKLDPNFLSAWTLIGHEYVEMKNTSAAIDAYRHAVDLNVRDYRAWYGLGQAYEILNMYLYSIYYYRKAAAIRPYDARMWCALGGCYEKLHKGDEAVACFKRAVGNQDREGVASYHLGRIFALRSEQHEAAKYYQLHLGLRQAPVALLGRGGSSSSSSTSAGASDSAVDDGAHVLVLPKGGMNISVDTPQALAAILFLANYYKQLGKYTEAALFCNRLLDLQGPEKEEAKALLREMRSLEAAKVRAASVAP